VSAPRLCLRCDWAGDTDAVVCRDCGAPLYRPAHTETEPLRRETAPIHLPRPLAVGGSAAVAPAGRLPAPVDAVEPVRRPRSLAVFAVVAVMLAGAAFAWVRAHTPAPAGPATGLSGRLVYAVADGNGWSRLWTWDLETNAVARGPLVREATELVNAYGAGDGWIGVTSRLPDGRFSGGVLRYLEPTDQVTPLLTADLMAWGARGEGLAGVRKAPGGACGRLQVLYAGLVAPRGTEVRVDQRSCADVVTIGRDDLRTYLTLRRGHGTKIVFAGLDRFHPVLDGYALASVSVTADLVVIPAGVEALPEGAFSDPHGGLARAGGAALFFRGLRGGRPIAYVDPPGGFALTRVLGWSSDASMTLVAGRSAGREGVYELDAGPSAGDRAPRLLTSIDGDVFATYMDDGTGIVANGGALSTLIEGRLNPLALPRGAPTPAGPIVWIR